jgi:hypothetical protein
VHIHGRYTREHGSEQPPWFPAPSKSRGAGQTPPRGFGRHTFRPGSNRCSSLWATRAKRPPGPARRSGGRLGCRLVLSVWSVRPAKRRTREPGEPTGQYRARGVPPLRRPSWRRGRVAPCRTRLGFDRIPGGSEPNFGKRPAATAERRIRRVPNRPVLSAAPKRRCTPGRIAVGRTGLSGASGSQGMGERRPPGSERGSRWS